MSNSSVIIVFIVTIVASFGIIYTYYNIYKIMISKCRFCGKKIENKFKKSIKFGYTLQKPSFVCQSCKAKR